MTASIILSLFQQLIEVDWTYTPERFRYEVFLLRKVQAPRLLVRQGIFQPQVLQYIRILNGISVIQVN